MEYPLLSEKTNNPSSIRPPRTRPPLPYLAVVGASPPFFFFFLSSLNFLPNKFLSSSSAIDLSDLTFSLRARRVSTWDGTGKLTHMVGQDPCRLTASTKQGRGTTTGVQRAKGPLRRSPTCQLLLLLLPLSTETIPIGRSRVKKNSVTTVPGAVWTTS